MADTDTTAAAKAASAGLSPNERRTGVWVAVGLLVLVFGFTFALTARPFVDQSNPFWFIGLLVIFGAALALIAVAFRWLGLANRDEAFGLPTGSVRALLAIGVMVLFAVFGLVAVSVSEGGYTRRVADQALATATVAATPGALEAEIRRYEQLGLAVVVDSVAASGATLKLYRVDSSKPAETSDMQKQLLTALVTLLTSIISFYFGSRSSEAARSAADKAGATEAATRADGSGPSATWDADLKALDTAIESAADRLAALRAETPPAGHEQALAAALGPLGAESDAMAADRVALTALVADLQAGRSTSDAATTALAALRQRVQAVAQQLGAAEALVARS